MEVKGLLVLRMLLNHFHPNVAEGLLKCLPQEDIKKILGQEVQELPYTLMITKPDEAIQKIHYSWLKPVIENQPSFLQPFFISVLPESHQKGLLKMMDKPLDPLPLSKVIKHFFTHQLHNKLNIRNLIPLDLLPPSNISGLMTSNKQELVELIDFLGLHDLAEEMRYIVDKKQLRSLYNLLTPKKQKYLKVCLHQKEKIMVPKLGLAHWHESRQKLETLLHRRGMIRLAKALSNQHPDFLWYIVHTLDVGRGGILMKYSTFKENPAIPPILAKQIVGLMKFLKQDLNRE